MAINASSFATWLLLQTFGFHPCVVQKTVGDTNIRILDACPVTASTPVVFISPYDIQNLKWKAAPGEVYPANLTPYSSQIFSSPAFNLLAPTAKKRL